MEVGKGGGDTASENYSAHNFFKVIFVGRIIFEIKYVTEHVKFTIIGSLHLLCGQYSIEEGGGNVES